MDWGFVVGVTCLGKGWGWVVKKGYIWVFFHGEMVHWEDNGVYKLCIA